ncbi:MAG: FecR family protein [Patescibacteria group bacterium]|nr:FecR family protein [Patescibacteria group bacterium]
MIKRTPRVRAGVNEYFARKPQRPQINIKRKSSQQFNNGNFMTYLYWILGGLAAVALIYFVGSFLKTTGISAKLVFQEGDVFVKKYSQEEWEKVEVDTRLKKLDEIKTMEGARAIISFEDGDIIRMNEFSRIILSEEDGDVSIIQTDGTTYHRVVKNEKRKYKVEFTGIEGASKTKIESLGTAFWVEKIGTELSVGVLEGKIKYLNEERETSLEIEDSQKIVVKNGQENKKDIDRDDLQDDFIAWNIGQDGKKEMALGSSVRLKLAEITEATNQEQSESTNNEDNQEEETNNQEKAITLNGEATTTGVTLKWELKNVEAPEGFKVVKSTQRNPEYPGSYYRSVRSGETTSYTWDTTDGETYYFRVCIYDGSSGCQLYSDDLEVETVKVSGTEKKTDCESSGGTWDSEEEKCDCPSNEELENGRCKKKTSAAEKESCTDSGGDWDTAKDKCDCPEDEVLTNERCIKEKYATSVSLSGSSKKKKEASLSWSISGGNATNGYKIVKSKSKNPTYPSDSSKSISAEGTKSYTWKELKKGETYHFRVCVWDGSKCVTYSNDDRVIVDD